MTGWPSCSSDRSCHKKRLVAAAVKTGRFSRRLQLAPRLEPPTSWSPSPVTTPNIYGRAESLKSPGLGGDLCEDRKIYGRSSVSHPVRCPRHGGAQLGGGALLHSRTVGWHARGSLRLFAVSGRRRRACAAQSLPAHPCGASRSEPNFCSNQICGTSTRLSTADREKSIHPLKGRSPVGQPEARSIGGLRNVGSGSDACGARTVASDGSRLLIFVVE
jgi:hypothetical protein